MSPSRNQHSAIAGISTDSLGVGADQGPDSDGSSSGSTTLSATSSPGGAGNGNAGFIGGGTLSGIV